MRKQQRFYRGSSWFYEALSSGQGEVWPGSDSYQVAGQRLTPTFDYFVFYFTTTSSTNGFYLPSYLPLKSSDAERVCYAVLMLVRSLFIVPRRPPVLSGPRVTAHVRPHMVGRSLLLLLLSGVVLLSCALFSRVHLC